MVILVFHKLVLSRLRFKYIFISKLHQLCIILIIIAYNCSLDI